MGNVDNISSVEHDKELIDKLKNRFDINTKEGIDSLHRMIATGKVRFESSIGDDFDDYITKLHNNPELIGGSGKSKKVSKTSKSKITENKAATDKTKRKTNVSKASKTENVKMEDFDESMQEAIKMQLKKREKSRRLLVTICSLVAICSIGYYLIYYFTGSKKDQEYREVAALVGKDNLASDKPITVTATINNEEKILTVLPKYETLYNSNKKLIGWIKIDDTNIDYPVMQCDDNTYYLNHDFNQNESKAGSLFLDYQCDVINGCDNYIIYGHHLSSGGMFSKLSAYESESYYNKHKYIVFDTIYEEQTFQVMFAFRSRVYDSDEVVFRYYQFINANSEEEFNSYMKEMREDSFYDTGVAAYYGDQLLTLSTCDYNEKNGRFVVVAKRIY